MCEETAVSWLTFLVCFFTVVDGSLVTVVLATVRIEVPRNNSVLGTLFVRLDSKAAGFGSKRCVCVCVIVITAATVVLCNTRLAITTVAVQQSIPH